MNDSVIAAAITALSVSLVLTVVFYIWVALALQAVFRKTGEEGWKAWVPVYNGVILLQLGGISGWWMLLVIVPGVSIVLYVMMIIACHRINAGFGYGAGMTVLAALLFPVWASVVGWSSNRWVGAVRPSGHGPVRSGSPAPSASEAASLGWLTNSAAVPGSPARSAQPAPPTATTATGGGPIDVPPVPPLPRPAVADAPVSAGSIPPAPVSPAPVWAAPVSPAPVWAAVPPAHVSTAPDAAGYVPEAPDSSASAPFVPAAASSQDAPLARLPIEISPTGYVPFDEEDDDDMSSGVVFGEPPLTPAPPVDFEPPAPRRTGSFIPLPAAEDDGEGPNPWAPPSATRAPLRSPEPNGMFSDTSGEVSAVAGAPALGGPMSARSSVSAQRSAPEIPESEDLFDETIVAPRKRTAWVLIPPIGAPIAIARDVLILGRRPDADPEHPEAQLVPIADETRTVSKTHARLELSDDTWVITDLGSTNGITLIGDDGGEMEAAAGRPLPVIERFLLGDAELRLQRDGA